MNCPVCNVELKMADRVGVEISYCGQCRGVWLDRGALDRIIDRTSGRDAEPRQADYAEQHHGQHHEDEYRGRRKRSFLSNLFDD